MKNVAVLIQGIDGDYSQNALNGVLKFYADKQVNTIVMQTRRPIMNEGVFEEQYWASLKLLTSEDIDGIIFITGEISSHVRPIDMAKQFAYFEGKEVCSIAMDIPFKFDHAYTYTSCDEAYEEVVNHMVNVHGCKRFAFLSAGLTKSSESIDRKNAFLKAIEKAGISRDSVIEYKSDFTMHSTKEIIAKEIKSKDDVKFDALIAANDRMAIGAMDALHNIGLECPKDFKVFGYDDSFVCKTTDPTISSINQDVMEQGRVCAEILYKRLMGEETACATSIGVRPIYRQSCGCEDCNENHKKLSYDDRMWLVQNRSTTDDLAREALSSSMDVMKLYQIISQTQGARSLDSVVESFEGIVSVANETIKSITVELYDKGVRFSKLEEFDLPRRARQLVSLDLDNSVKDVSDEKSFNPARELTPGNLLKGEKSELFMIHPIFFEDTHYGYIICKMKKRAYALNFTMLKAISNMLARAYEYTKTLRENDRLINKNKELSSQKVMLSKESRTDELTKIMNRRGFLEYGQQTIDLAVDMGKTGCVFFGDMNGLKNINDTYGHNMGDEAIKVQTEILKKSFRSNDIIGRLGGDEFAIVAQGASIEQLEFFRTKVNENCEKLVKNKKLPFEITISIGAVTFDSENSDLEDLIQRADEKQYIEKRKYHSGRDT